MDMKDLAPFQSAVYRLCYEVLRHPQNAEDAAQRVFLDVLHVVPELRDENHLRAWLYRAALVTSLNLRRSEGRRRRHEGAADVPGRPPLSAEDLDAIHEEIARLDDELRVLVVEHYFAKTTLATLAEREGCSVPAVWKRLRKAEDQLRTSLSRAGFASLALLVPAYLGSRPRELMFLGGLAVKGKLIAAGVLLLSVSLLAVAARRPRTSTPPAAPLALPSPATPASPSLAKAARLPSVALAEEVELPDTLDAFWAAFRKALLLPEAERNRALRRLGLRRSDVDFRSALARVKERKEARTSAWAAFDFILGDWMRAEPEGAAAFLRAMPAGEDLDDPWYNASSLILRWGLEDSAAALAFLKLLPDVAELKDTRNHLELRRRWRSDPDGYLAWLRSLPAGEERKAALGVAIRGWAAADPRGAADWVEGLPENEREAPLFAIAGAWARANLPAAREWARRYVEAPEATPGRTNVLRGLLEGATEIDPLWSVETARACRSESLSPFSQVFAVWLERDPAAAIRYFESARLSEDDLANAEMEITLRRTEEDLGRALDWLAARPDRGPGSMSRAIYQHLFERLALAEGSDPNDLARRIEKMPEWARPSAMNGLLVGWARFDPPSAAAFADGLAPQARPSSALGAIVSSWIEEDPLAALAWTRGLKDAAARDEGLYRLTPSIAARSLSDGLALAAEIADPETRSQARNTALAEGARRDPAAAVKALASLPHPDLRAYLAVVDGFLARNPEAGVAWALTLPETHRSRPEGAPADAFEDESPLRSRVLGQIFRLWGMMDAAAARRALESSELPPDLKEALLSPR